MNTKRRDRIWPIPWIFTTLGVVVGIVWLQGFLDVPMKELMPLTTAGVLICCGLVAAIQERQ